MPRQSRDDRAGQVYHVLNRGNQRQSIFHKAQDYEAFIRVLAEGLQKYSVELFSFTLMPNHWHLVLRPVKDGQMGRFIAGTSQKNPTQNFSHAGRSGGYPDGTSELMPPYLPVN